MTSIRRSVISILVLGTALVPRPAAGQRPATSTPRAILIADTETRFSGNVDSNTPAVWIREPGHSPFVVLTPAAGEPKRATGTGPTRLGIPEPITITPWPGEGVWMEAIVPAADGTWYGFYHNERVATVCGDTSKVAPRVGAARSTDGGLTWTNLGVLI